MSYSFTTTTTFTRTHARHLAAKVVADLYQCHVLYGRPAEDQIPLYEEELIELLVNGYLETYEFGFKKDDRRVLTWRYAVRPDGGLGDDSGAGGIYARAQVAAAGYFNFVTHSQKWSSLTEPDRAAFESGLPIRRANGYPPEDGNGYWQADRGYSAGGLRMDRGTFRPL